jgi:uncharacterized membrane protein
MWMDCNADELDNLGPSSSTSGSPPATKDDAKSKSAPRARTPRAALRRRHEPLETLPQLLDKQKRNLATMRADAAASAEIDRRLKIARRLQRTPAPRVKKRLVKFASGVVVKKRQSVNHHWDLKYAADFAGLESPLVALHSKGYIDRRRWVCESNVSCRRLVRSTFGEADIEYTDITQRDNNQLPTDLDLYTAGPPCQPWSRGGGHDGLRDPRGKLWVHTILAGLL